MIYRKYQTKKGMKYSQDNRFVAKDKVPPGALELLENSDEVKYDTCLFCLKTATKTRLANQVTVYLCNEHYYSTNIGKIVAELRRKESYGVDAKV